MAGAAAGAAQAGGVQQINVCGGSNETSGADLCVSRYTLERVLEDQGLSGP